MSPRTKKIAGALAAGLALSLAVLLPARGGPPPVFPTLLNPRTGATFPQSTLTTGATCPAGQQCNAKGTCSASVTIKLPSGADGAMLAIIDADGCAGGVHPITVDANGNLIDGSATTTIATNGGGLVATYSTNAHGWYTTLFQRVTPQPGSPVFYNVDDRAQSVAGPVTLAGDVTGPSNANTAAKINGAAVTPAGGALTTGTVLRVTGASAAAWGALDLSNAGAITGVLPIDAGVLPSVSISSLDIDWHAGSVFYKTLSAGANVITFSGVADGQTITTILTGAASTVTWPAVLWAGGTPPTQTASGTDACTFIDRGGTFYGSCVQDLK